MKKLSLMLALVLVLACALVACGGNEAESSVDESVTESEAASEAVSTEESTEESTAESTEESVEESKPEVNVTPADVNLAAGKSYTTSDLFRQGSNGFDANAPISYPDEDNKTLTDGAIAPDGAKFTDVEWVGFNGHDPNYIGYHWITLDLGEKTDLAKYVFKYGTSALTAGITAPFTIEIFVSDDGENWGDAIGSDVPPESETDVNGVYELVAAASGRYVQFRFTSLSWAFISEIEAYGVAE